MRRIYINGEPISYYLSNRRRIDSELSQVKPGSIKWKKLVKVTALILFAMSSSGFASGGIDAIGNKAYDILMDIAAWYAIIGCGLDLLKHGLNGTTNNVGKTVMNYLLIYASIAMLPWLIEMIKGVLK